MPAEDVPPAAAARPPSLRQRTRLAMRTETSDVAFRLFAEQGFDGTTVEQIAAEAGVSRATFFRYFGSKEDLVLDRMIDLGHHVAEALVARPHDEPPWRALRRAFDVLVEPTGEGSQEWGATIQLFSDACAVMTRRWEKTVGWQSLLVPEVARRLDEGSAADRDLGARAMVSSAVSCLDAATDAWIASGARTPLGRLLDQAMGALSTVR